MTPPNKQENGNIPRWLIGLLIFFATSLATVGAIAITNGATMSEYKDSQKTQFHDIKNRLERIENKIDELE